MIANGELRALVADTMAVWGTPGVLTWQGTALSITAADGRAATISRGGPARWLLEAQDRRARPCSSIIGLLAALRVAVGPDGTPPPLRVVAAAP